MNKLGLHANVWVRDWSREDCVLAVNKTAELGFDIIEISAPDPKAMDIAFTAKELQKAGIRANLSLGLDAASDISSGDADRVKAGETRLREVIAAAAELGSSHVCGILYSAFQKYSEPPTAAGIAGAVDVLTRIGEEADRHGITLGLEVVNRYETNVLNTAGQGVELCKRVGLPNVKVHLDSYHMNIEEADVEMAIVDAGEHLGYFHIGESNRGYLGAGSVDFVAIFNGLARIDYTGPIVFESFSSTVVGQPLCGILGIWRNLWTDGEDLARHAKAFIQAHRQSAGEVGRDARRSALP
ncbi:MAG TPA: sugar phosphate isomerase/epimerase [Shinella sp.]|jgi:D-psicose/D-tagatose/L-ribulose 3-epimerase|uniref:sugar phosphate isomerase/epimerase family protein n=1 Tax=Shinella sp. TaxID=1870904 RepID=UPI002E112B35|nr:sugar phosphate isomerase/epimerase [Shinella sp.]